MHVGENDLQGLRSDVELVESCCSDVGHIAGRRALYIFSIAQFLQIHRILY